MLLQQPEVSDFVIESVFNLVNADERYIEKIVAAEQNLQNRMDKQGQYTNSLLILTPHVFL
jgi:hypothetical protein